MHMLSNFCTWVLQASDKKEKIEFKTQREAAEFVRRIYNESGTPNPALVALYRRGSAVKSQANKAG